MGPQTKKEAGSRKPKESIRNMQTQKVTTDIRSPFRFHTAWSKVKIRGRSEHWMSFEDSINLRMFLMTDFNEAKSWSGLIERLTEKGFQLAFQGDRLTLFDRHTGIALCTCRFLGFSFRELFRSFGKPTVIAGSCRLVPEA